ncbi:sulfotransferase family protein [Pseudodesulfovibrio portus]|uniref:Sulfotransferase family protein n=1 Tax=Pseudodesulfovibrio portus TaxID=231439 RepID=A0ABM8ANN5_9BACT|nr:sulfotransferase family protein [Pseudodesulfovibrio portus]BDQ33027.1 hypothetical protein JCM14722_05690 [Pseudodesulfovibrio portus]
MASPLLFLHIPKTAGTTLNAVLDANFAPGSVLDLYTAEQHRAIRDITYDGLAEYDLIRGHIFVQDYDELLDGPVPVRMFTFLRDPVQRVISEYFFLKRWPKSHLHKYLNENNVSLIDYVTSDIGVLRRRGSNNMTNSLSGTKSHSPGERLRTAWHHLSERFACFGILERFDESLLMLAATAGFSETFYERQNVRAVDADRIVTPAELDVIAEYNRLDVRLYEMAVLEFDRRVQAMGSGFQSDLRLFTKVNERFQHVAEMVNLQAGLEQGAIVNAK